MNLPFLGGRSKAFALTEHFCRNLGIFLDTRETTSRKRAWAHVKESIDLGIPVGLQLDCYHLDYFGNAFHCAGHFLALYRYDDISAYVVDTVQQGSFQKTSLENLEKARFEKGPMSAKARSWTMKVPEKLPPLEKCHSQGD
jgi:hypothetical protein